MPTHHVWLAWSAISTSDGNASSGSGMETLEWEPLRSTLDSATSPGARGLHHPSSEESIVLAELGSPDPDVPRVALRLCPRGRMVYIKVTARYHVELGPELVMEAAPLHQVIEVMYLPPEQSEVRVAWPYATWRMLL